MAEYVMEYDGWAEGIPVGEYLKVRNAMHARKREEVVRCKDCKFFATNIHGSYCKKSITRLSSPDGFCAWGRSADG